jgi:hypothetical protein
MFGFFLFIKLTFNDANGKVLNFLIRKVILHFNILHKGNYLSQAIYCIWGVPAFQGLSHHKYTNKNRHPWLFKCINICRINIQKFVLLIIPEEPKHSQCLHMMRTSPLICQYIDKQIRGGIKITI